MGMITVSRRCCAIPGLVRRLDAVHGWMLGVLS